MSAVEHTVEIDRPPAEVFAVATDPRRFAEWQDDVVRVEVDGDTAGLGARFTTVRRIGRTERAMVQEVTALEPPHRWAARAVAGAVRPSAAITIEELADGTRSRVRFALDVDVQRHGAGDLLAPVVRRMAAKAAPRSYRRLKHLLESAAR